jgi:hypothetical protein
MHFLGWSTLRRLYELSKDMTSVYFRDLWIIFPSRKRLQRRWFPLVSWSTFNTIFVRLHQTWIKIRVLISSNNFLKKFPYVSRPCFYIMHNVTLTAGFSRSIWNIPPLRKSTSPCYCRGNRHSFSIVFRKKWASLRVAFLSLLLTVAL